MSEPRAVHHDLGFAGIYGRRARTAAGHVLRSAVGVPGAVLRRLPGPRRRPQRAKVPAVQTIRAQSPAQLRTESRVRRSHGQGFESAAGGPESSDDPSVDELRQNRV